MFLKSKKKGKIFISYRRSDTQGYAGRLSDSLEAYFGGNRVFRDIEHIKGGSEFAKDINNQMRSADAVIVLIGPQWLTITDDKGNRRIDDPNDWVVQEIVMAIEQGIRVFPVLIEGTVLPRKEELPEKLARVLDYNAITISDKKWEDDILGLGKIISFDVPTTNERILFYVQTFIYSLLGVSLIFPALTIAQNALNIENINLEETGIISLPIAATPFYVIVASLILLSLILRLIAEDKRKYIIYSLITGTVGSSFFFFGLVFIRETRNLMEETMFVYFGSVLVSVLMYLFLGLSGFKPK